MSTILCVDEENFTELGQDGTEQQTPPCPEISSHFQMKASIMNSKFLYVATLAVSLLSTLAMADEAVVSRSQVKAELSKAIANGTRQRTDDDDVALMARRAKAHTASAAFAQRVKTALSPSES